MWRSDPSGRYHGPRDRVFRQWSGSSLRTSGRTIGRDGYRVLDHATGTHLRAVPPPGRPGRCGPADVAGPGRPGGLPAGGGARGRLRIPGGGPGRSRKQRGGRIRGRPLPLRAGSGRRHLSADRTEERSGSMGTPAGREGRGGHPGLVRPEAGRPGGRRPVRSRVPGHVCPTSPHGAMLRSAWPWMSRRGWTPPPGRGWTVSWLPMRR